MVTNKYSILKKGLLFDAIGMLSMVIPVIGPFLDILWAPYAAKKMRDMYDGEAGKIASIVVFVEEILPITDFIPTFTLMWIYTFAWKREKVKIPQTVEVEIN
jgi:hypothetical protein